VILQRVWQVNRCRCRWVMWRGTSSIALRFGGGRARGAFRGRRRGSRSRIRSGPRSPWCRRGDVGVEPMKSEGIRCGLAGSDASFFVGSKVQREPRLQVQLRTSSRVLVKQTKARRCRRSTGWLRQSFLATLRGGRYKSVGSLVGNLDVAWSSS